MGCSATTHGGFIFLLLLRIRHLIRWLSLAAQAPCQADKTIVASTQHGKDRQAWETSPGVVIIRPEREPVNRFCAKGGELPGVLVLIHPYRRVALRAPDRSGLSGELGGAVDVG